MMFVSTFFFGGVHIRRGLYLWGLIFGVHFVLVSEYQDLKIHCYISLLWAKIGVSLGQHNLYFA